MTIESIAQAAFLVAALLFILALAGLSKHETAKAGNTYGIAGMAVALVATIALAIDRNIESLGLILIGVAMVVGAAIGLWRARVVEMTGMPELIALLHSFVGLAAVLVGWNGYLLVEGGGSPEEIALLTAEGTLGIHSVEVFVGVFIGAVTFTGSIVAYGKLAGRVDSAATKLPGGHMLNAGAASLSLITLIWYFNTGEFFPLFLMTLAALFIGYHLIMGIGGADMPVVVSMLNSYSGWAAAAIGFSLGNDLMIVVGALVGSSGAILSYIMCKAMNRSFVSVILGGFGGPAGEQMAVEGEQIAIEAEGVAMALNEADSVVIIPGYGMAVAQAQYRCATVTQICAQNGKMCASHPSGRRSPARPYECPPRRSEGALRHRARDGRDQR